MQDGAGDKFNCQLLWSHTLPNAVDDGYWTTVTFNTITKKQRL